MIIPAPTPSTEEAPIVASTFWPEIEPAKVRADQRIDNTITPERLAAMLTEALIVTIEALAAWKAEQVANGYARLQDVPSEPIGDRTAHEHRFHRAVGCLAKAQLLERYRDFDSTGKGDKKAEVLSDPIDDLRRDWHNAIADIVGRSRCTVELI